MEHAITFFIQKIEHVKFNILSKGRKITKSDTWLHNDVVIHGMFFTE